MRERSELGEETNCNTSRVQVKRHQRVEQEYIQGLDMFADLYATLAWTASERAQNAIRIGLAVCEIHDIQRFLVTNRRDESA